MTDQEFAREVRERLVDAHQAASIGGYAFRQGFWRAVQAGIMPQPIVTFANLALWDAREIEQATKGGPA
jgi:hypothetical protein